MGWIFAAETHGQGHGARSVAGGARMGQANLDPTPIWAIIAPANEPSLALAERLGFERMSKSQYNGQPTVVLRRPAWALG